MTACGIPSYMQGGLLRYIVNHIEPGSFLSAVLCNNLKEAVACADEVNRNILCNYVFFLYNYAPSQCWGSAHRVEKWLENAEPENDNG